MLRFFSWLLLSRSFSFISWRDDCCVVPKYLGRDSARPSIRYSFVLCHSLFPCFLRSVFHLCHSWLLQEAAIRNVTCSCIG
jgi:hypothetical protein